MIKNELYKLYKFAEALIEFNKDYNEKKQYVISNVFDHFNKLFGIDLEKPYLDFIEQIVENYFQIKLYKSHKATNFLGLI